jgi:flagellar biosynthesis protein
MRTIKKAIALEYGKNRAPIVTAKGEEEAALEMIAQAREYGVYVTEDPKLLALLSRLKVDQEIPAELFTAVSVILSWVYWLKGMRPGDEKTAPEAPSNGQASAEGMPTEAAAMFDELSSGLDGLGGFGTPPSPAGGAG